MMRILIALSPSTEDRCADPLGAAVSLPWPEDTEFRVLTVTETVHSPVIGLMPEALAVPDVQRKVDTAAANLCSSAVGVLRDHGWQAEGVSLEGDPKTQITDFAKEWGADLVVVGSCDLPAVERFFVGSVSQSVVKHSPCSVLVEKPRRDES
jgi:nucleotide-binding universal stress UspA family protein